MPRQLTLLFCERFGCPPNDYADRAFLHCLYSHARLAAPLLLKVRPNFFTEDSRFIADLGHATTMHEAKADYLNFNDANGSSGNFWRRTFRLRVSGRKAMSLARELFSKEH
jgi:hypothetical protein